DTFWEMRTYVVRILLAGLTAVLAVNLWTGAPLFAIWVGSRVQKGTGLTMSTVIVVMAVLAASVALLVFALTRVEAAYKAVTGQQTHRRTPPWLRWRLQEVPLGLDYPYWSDDIDFDLDFHVRELALPAPGSDAQLAEQVARITSRPLDRARPLWELYLISGLESKHIAMLTKIHHALIDGISGAEIMGLLLDLEPEGRELTTPAR